MDTQYQPTQNSFSPDNAPAQAPAQQMPAPQINQVPPQAPKTDDGHKLKGSTVLLLLLLLLALVVGISVMIKNNSREVEQIEQKATIAMPSSTVLNYYKPLKMGTVDSDVAILQQFLTDKGFYSGEITNTFDLATKNAGKAYRESIGVKPGTGNLAGAFDKISWKPLLGVMPSYTLHNSTCVVDFDEDGFVGINDYIMLDENYSSQAQSSIFDINKNGVINIEDTLLFMKYFGKQSYCPVSHPNLPAGGVEVSEWPEADGAPTGSDWSEVVTWAGEHEWAWDYKAIKTTTYKSKKIYSQGGPASVWIHEPAKVETLNPSTKGGSLKNIFSNPSMPDSEFENPSDPKLEMLNGKLNLVTTREFQDPAVNSGLPWKEVVYREIVPNAGSVTMNTIDVVLEKVGNKIKNQTFVNQKHISEYTASMSDMSGNLPPYSSVPPAGSSVMQNPLVKLAISDTSSMAYEVGYDFPSFTDSRLEEFNIVDGEAGYNPVTNTISVDLDSDSSKITLVYIYDPNTQVPFTPDTLWYNMSPFIGKGAHLSCDIYPKTGIRKLCY